MSGGSAVTCKKRAACWLLFLSLFALFFVLLLQEYKVHGKYKE